VRYGFDTETFHVAIETAAPLDELLGRGAIHLYLGYPGQVGGAPFVNGSGSTLVGFDAAAYLEIDADGARLVRRVDDRWGATSEAIRFAAGSRSIEMSIPLERFGDLESGDEISFATFTVEANGVRDRLPRSGPAKTNVPDLGGGELVLSVDDPVGDDHGPGSYTYPQDSVFAPGVFDLTEFLVEEEEDYLKFSVSFDGPIQNHWGSGIGLSLQTVDIYIDTDPGQGTGARRLLEGRNAAMPAEFGWEYAVWVEGWNQKVLVPDDPARRDSRPVEMSGSPLKVRVDADAAKIIIRVPTEVIDGYDDPASYGYTLAILSQEGFPSAGVRRVRNMGRSSGQWVFGGAPADVNHTRIVDMAVPADAAVSQEQLLSDYEAVSSGSADAVELDQLPAAYVNTVE